MTIFRAIRHQLLFYYLAILTVILAVFTITIRISFAHSLQQELAEKIATLAQAARGELDLENGQLEVDGADLRVGPNQAVQWFDLQGKLIGQRGNSSLTLPFDPKQISQTQLLPGPPQSLTLLVREEEKNNQPIGYVRVSGSWEEIDETLQRLDWGLASGVILALIFSGLGGFWLTAQAMRPIEKSMQRLRQFTADASHELRNPLMAISSNATVALKYPQGMRESDVEKFAAIANAANQMKGLTADLLLLARDDNIYDQNWQSVDLAAMLRSLVQSHESQAKAKHIQLSLHLVEPLHLQGDADQLSRLFTNLFSNALHYTPDNGRVEIRASQTGQSLVVQVQDTGIGIAAEHLERVFDRFWRANPSRSYTEGGTGLGLAIAQSIAQSHGGYIKVTSQIGVGSCFTVRFSSVGIHPGIATA